eukprot:TRINITY_DN6796_c0_g1_i1.p1 TRINITY_DN6796_c0_g1~~TRINITY_DN6796_c0_g1_i1.p1  ORF type:complete len:944 (-),score=172.72 TRINITY_DN6796_c0_g1_i1:158-2989(-)
MVPVLPPPGAVASECEEAPTDVTAVVSISSERDSRPVEKDGDCHGNRKRQRRRRERTGRLESGFHSNPAEEPRGANTGAFQELLSRLAEQHEHELGALRMEVEALRARIGLDATGEPVDFGGAQFEAHSVHTTAAQPSSASYAAATFQLQNKRKSLKELTLDQSARTVAFQPIEQQEGVLVMRRRASLEGGGRRRSAQGTDAPAPGGARRRSAQSVKGTEDGGLSSIVPMVTGNQTRQISPGKEFSRESFTSDLGDPPPPATCDPVPPQGLAPSAVPHDPLGLQKPEVPQQFKDSKDGKITLLSSWVDTNTFHFVNRRISRAKTDNRERERLVYGDRTTTTGRCLSRFALNPSSIRRLTWDMIGFFVLTYDLVLIPFTSAFDPGETLFMVFMNWVTLLFWTFDMFLSCCTGYMKGGDTIMVHSRILLHYAKTWLFADLLLVGLDWFLIVSYSDNSASDAVRQGRSLRMLRYVRSLRLIRIMKLRKIMNEIQYHINTEFLSTFFSIAKTIVALVACNHLIACAWFAIGTASDTEHSWVAKNKILERDIAYQYTTSLHWSLTQFTPASMEIYPLNVAERSFSVVVLVFALVTFSSFLSNLTASITCLNSMRSAEVRQFWMLRRYLRDLKISRELTLRVQRYCEYTWEKRQKKVMERDVGLLAHVSEPLKEEMKAETFSPYLKVHPLLDYLQGTVRHFSNALTSVELARGDPVFCYGEVAHEMIVVVQGELEYLAGGEDEVDDGECGEVADLNVDPSERSQATSKDQQPASDPLAACENRSNSSSEGSSSGLSGLNDTSAIMEREWISEPALWTRWDHLGYLEAMSECQLIVIDAKKFNEVVCRNAASLAVAQRYAKTLVEAMNRIDRMFLSDVLDRSIIHSAFRAVDGQRTHTSRSVSFNIRRKTTRTSLLNPSWSRSMNPKKIWFQVTLRGKTLANRMKNMVVG